MIANDSRPLHLNINKLRASCNHANKRPGQGRKPSIKVVIGKRADYTTTYDQITHAADEVGVSHQWLTEVVSRVNKTGEKRKVNDYWIYPSKLAEKG